MLPRGVPVLGDPPTTFFLPYVYKSIGYYFIVTPAGSVRVNEPFETSMWKLTLLSTLTVVLATALYYFSKSRAERKRIEERRRKWNDAIDLTRKKWSVADEVVFKDFERLACGISIVQKLDGQEPTFVHVAPLRKKRGEKSIDRKRTSATVLRVLDEQLSRSTERENPDLENLARMKKTCPRLFNVLAAINQSVIFPAIMYINTDLMDSNVPLLDKRCRDAWLVDVTFNINEKSKSSASVTHRRWARTMPDPASPEYVEFQWSLRLEFADDFKTLVTCHLEFGDAIPGAATSTKTLLRISRDMRLKHAAATFARYGAA
eukprot:g1517.t1